MLSRAKRALIGAAFAVGVAVVTAGCAGPLKVAYAPSGHGAKTTAGVSLEVAALADSRPEHDRGSRTIGKINATVADMSAGDLTLSEDVETIVTGAYKKEFAAAGYEVVERDGDFIVNGAVKKFRLDVGSRDEIELSVAVSVKEKETGRTLLDATFDEKDSRYAGVMGNSRATLERYITATLSKAVGKTLDAAAPAIATSKSSYRPAPVRAPEDEKTVSGPEPGTGRLLVSTVPPRSRIYIDGVYWGLSPLASDIGPGVYDLVVKQKGFKEHREKISIRAGQVTEFEMDMEGE